MGRSLLHSPDERGGTVKVLFSFAASRPGLNPRNNEIRISLFARTSFRRMSSYHKLQFQQDTEPKLCSKDTSDEMPK